MADELPVFSLGFSCDPAVFFDLEDEKENELQVLAPMDIEFTVNDSSEFPTKLPTETPSEVVTKTNEDLQVQRFSRRTYLESRNRKIPLTTPKGLPTFLRVSVWL